MHVLKRGIAEWSPYIFHEQMVPACTQVHVHHSQETFIGFKHIFTNQDLKPFSSREPNRIFKIYFKVPHIETSTSLAPCRNLREPWPLGLQLIPSPANDQIWSSWKQLDSLVHCANPCSKDEPESSVDALFHSLFGMSFEICWWLVSLPPLENISSSLCSSSASCSCKEKE